MKKFVLFVAALLLVFGCSRPVAVAAKAPPAKVVPAPPPLKTFTTVLHGDTDFTPMGRVIIMEAAEKWRRVSAGRINIVVKFDLDFNSASDLAERKARHENFIVPVTSDFPIVVIIDSLAGGKEGMQVLAATAPMKDGSTTVFLIMDRISADSFESVVTHELGHVAGFPDLPVFGAVMSGVEVHGMPVPKDLTPVDVALCRKFLLCP